MSLTELDKPLQRMRRGGDTVSPTPEPCICPPGPPGPAGMKGKKGQRGSRGKIGAMGLNGTNGEKGGREIQDFKEWLDRRANQD